jgi:hypothetical protein
MYYYDLFQPALAPRNHFGLNRHQSNPKPFDFISLWGYTNNQKGQVWIYKTNSPASFPPTAS